MKIKRNRWNLLKGQEISRVGYRLGDTKVKIDRIIRCRRKIGCVYCITDGHRMMSQGSAYCWTLFRGGAKLRLSIMTGRGMPLADSE